MSIINPPFKKPPKKYVPHGIDIIYEDRDIIVVDKMYGLLSVGSSVVREKTASSLLQEYVKKGNSSSKARVFVVHRLDKETSGVLVFAKSEQAKRYLQNEWASFNKTFTIVVQGTYEEKTGIYESYLSESKGQKVYVVSDDKAGNLAKADYRVVKESLTHSLLEVVLQDGYKHQIRVQVASDGHPIAGDRVYGENEGRGGKRLMLHFSSITLKHPFSKKEMTFQTELPASFKTMVKNREGAKQNSGKSKK